MLNILEKQIQDNSSSFTEKADAMMVASFHVEPNARGLVRPKTSSAVESLITLLGRGRIYREHRTQARKILCSERGSKCNAL